MKEVNISRTETEIEAKLSGDIDSGNADAFYGAVMEEYNRVPADIVFRCADLTFIDSTTLGTFVKILKRTKTDGKKMKLVDLQPKIKKLFLICSLDSIMEIC